jgi:hypothetical protein
MLHPTKVPAVTGPPAYAAGKFVPAGTPVIFRIKDESGSMKLTIAGNSPSAALPSSSNIFSGKYLEQLLDVDAAHDVYTLGLPFVSDVSKDADYNTTGDIVAPLPEQGTSGLGFYINATANKENNASKARWDKNNRYVLHNKIYYRAGASPGASARRMDGDMPDFVPVIFEDEEEEGEEPNGNVTATGDNCVYDLQGRCVVSGKTVTNGTWRQGLSRGIYLLNGKKYVVR